MLKTPMIDKFIETKDYDLIIDIVSLRNECIALKDILQAYENNETYCYSEDFVQNLKDQIQELTEENQFKDIALDRYDNDLPNKRIAELEKALCECHEIKHKAQDDLFDFKMKNDTFEKIKELYNDTDMSVMDVMALASGGVI